MASAEKVVVELLAKTDGFDAKIRGSGTALNQVLGKVRDSSDKTEKAVRDDFRRIEREMSASSSRISGTIKGLAGTLAAAFSGRELVGLLDSFTRLQNNLRVAGVEGESLKLVQDRLFESAQKYGVELEGLSSLFSSLTQASAELGATQNQIFTITDAVSASLKVTGISANEAGGALLQLQQVFRGNKVQAEEYNSLIDSLYPLLQAAAAGSDRWGGSVGRLTRDVKDSSVTSKEFFDAILAGAGVLEDKAANATLTLSAGVTTLTNALTVYFGEADKANGVSAALGATLAKLAENLDVIIPAITAIAAAIGIRYVTAMGAAAGATIAKSVADVRATQTAVALAAAQARLGPLMLGNAAAANAAAASVTRLSVAQGVAARGAAGLAALFGGPVGLAVAGVAAGFYLASKRVEENGKASAAYQKIESDATDIRKRAADAAQTLATATGKAAVEARKNAAATKEEARALIATARAALKAAEAKAKAAAIEIQSNPLSGGSFAGPNPIRGIASMFGLGGRGEMAQANGDIKAARAAIEEAKAALAEFENFPKISGGIIEDDKKPKKTPKPPKPVSGPSAEELENAYTSDLARLQAEELQARISLTTDIDKRADLQRELLALEKRERLREIDTQSQRDLADVNADETTTPEEKANLAKFIDEQRQAQVAIVDALYGRAQTIRDANGDIVINPAIGQYTQQVLDDLNEEILRQKRDDLAMQLDVLDSQADIERNVEARNQIEQRAIAIQQEIERSLLEQQIANGEIAEADRARALLAQRQANDREALSQSQQSPFEQYISDLQDAQSNMSLELESLGVDVLNTFNDKLVDAIVNFRSLGDVGRAALATLTEGLVRLALQQIILRTIGSTLGQSATAATTAQASAAAAAWAPAAAAASLATLGANAGPAAAALASTFALSQGLATVGAVGRKDGGPIYGVGGPRDDKVLMAASPGEYVIKATSASKLGKGSLEYINRTGELPPAFAEGGSVRAIRPNNSPASAGRMGGGLDENALRRIESAVERGAAAQQPVNLYPTMNPASAMEAMLSSPGAQRKILDFFGQNSGKINSRLAR